MKHPLQEIQERQEEFLRNCPEEERAFHEYTFRVGNAAYIYHQQAGKGIGEETLKAYYKERLEGLPANIGRDMEAKGVEACKMVFPFSRYVSERTDSGMDQWMKGYLSEGDYKEWSRYGGKDMGGDYK